jgi:hypothetical protein
MLSGAPVREKARQTKIEREKTPHVSTTCGGGSTGRTRVRAFVADAARHVKEMDVLIAPSLLVLDKQPMLIGLDAHD